MSTNTLRLQVILQTLDRATAPLRKVRATSGETARALKATRDTLKQLNDQQKTIGEFRELRTGLKGSASDLASAQARVKALAQQIGQAGSPTKAMGREFDNARKKAAALGEQFQRQQQRAQQLRDRLSAAGISTSNLAAHERGLRGSIDATTRSIDQQMGKLKQLAQRQDLASAAGERYRGGMSRARGIGLGGAVATGIGLTVARRLRAPIDESKAYSAEKQRIHALGLGDQVSADAIKYAEAMKTYGTSTRDNLELVRDGLTVFADLHHAELVAPTLARMKFANRAIYGDEQGEENDKKFMDMLKVIELRGGLASEAIFKDQADKIQRVVVATGGRVQGEEWLNLIKTGGVAAKGLTDEALYYQMEPLVQEMGGHRVGTAMMSAYSNIYQGKTTKRSAVMLDNLGLIADPSKVKHDKVGQVAQLGVGALKGSELFRENQFEWMEQVLLPQLAAKGITEKQQVLDVMGGIFSNRTASNLFSQMYLQRDQIRKNAALNAGADSIDQLYDKARQTPAGAELQLEAKKANLYKQMGDSIMPAYVKALELTSAALQGLTRWMEANPRAAQIMAVALGVVAAGLVALGGLSLILAPLLMGFVGMNYLMAKAGIQGNVLSAAIRGVAATLRFAGKALFTLGRLLLMNPIGLAITGIAIAALLIYKYWEPIKEFFSGLWDDIKSGFNAAMEWFKGLPARFSAFGTEMLNGLAKGISDGLGAVKDAITGAGTAAIAWFKEKLGIRSPSRVFMQAGHDISQGAAIGIARQRHLVRKAAVGLAGAAAAALPLAAAGSESAGMLFDRRPPIAAAAPARGPVTLAGDTINITIQAASGMDPQALARAISAELDRRQQSKRARVMSSLSDID